MCLVARHLEASGIPTVIVGSALDIVEHCGVPRFVFSDFPLGNPCGKPWDVDMQRAIVAQALELFEAAETPRTTVEMPFRWEGDAWRSAYMEVCEEDREALLRKGVELRHRRAAMRSQKT